MAIKLNVRTGKVIVLDPENASNVQVQSVGKPKRKCGGCTRKIGKDKLQEIYDERIAICKECEHFNYNIETGEADKCPCDLLPKDRNVCQWKTLLKTGREHPHSDCPWHEGERVGKAREDNMETS